jgi:hypothetical protein
MRLRGTVPAIKSEGQPVLPAGRAGQSSRTSEPDFRAKLRPEGVTDVFRKTYLGAVGAVLAASVLVPGTLQAQGGVAGPWEFTVTPWLWLVNVGGELGVANGSVEFGADVDEVFDALEIGAMLHVEAQKGDLSLFAEPIWARFEGQGSVETPTGVTSASVTMQMALVDFGAGYRVYGPLQVVAGGRFIGTDLEATLGNRTPEAGQDLWNGFIGARIRQLLSDRWGVMLHGDVGFGESDSNYMLQAAAQFRALDWLGIDLGYKWLHNEVADDESVLHSADLDLYGAVVGVSFVF